jgi:hypothetical protein
VGLGRAKLDLEPPSGGHLDALDLDLEEVGLEGVDVQADAAHAGQRTLS